MVGVWFIRLLAVALVLLATFLRLVYLAWDCPLDLAPDEAHYWDWSRRLDWSYYSKGPLVAWLIRLGCLVAAPWSRWLNGSDMLAVRLPALVCGALLLASLYILTRQTYRREGLALLVVALALTMPLVAAGATLMTIDAPFICLWGWALVFGHLAIFRQAPWAWYAAGIVVGLGILAKYTMVLWLLSLGLFLLATPVYRPLLRQRGFWIMVSLALIACVPIVCWNAQHGWVTLQHTARHAGWQQQRLIHWLGPVQYLGGQFLVLLGFWFAIWLRAAWRHRPGLERQAEVGYLWWMSVPTFLFFLLFSVKNGGGEPNWPAAAYLSGLVLGAGHLATAWPRAGNCYRCCLAMAVTVFALLGLAVTFFAYESQLVHPWLAHLAGPATPERPLPMRRLDPTCRLRGWRTLAAAVQCRRQQLADQGLQPFLAAANWTLPAELAFYCADQPTVYSLGPALGDRHSQYDLWRPNPLADPQLFVGQTCIFVGPIPPILRQAFDQLEPSQIVTHYEQGRPLAQWPVTVCHGFRGLRTAASQSY